MERSELRRSSLRPEGAILIISTVNTHHPNAQSALCVIKQTGPFPRTTILQRHSISMKTSGGLRRIPLPCSLRGYRRSRRAASVPV